MVLTMSGGSPSAARLTLSRAKPTETSSLGKGDKPLAPDSPGLCEKAAPTGCHIGETTTPLATGIWARLGQLYD